MERIMQRMTGRVELAKEISKTMKGKLDAMFPQRSFNEATLERFSNFLEGQNIESELNFRELNDSYLEFREAEVTRLKKEGKFAESMLARTHLESFTTEALEVRQLRKHTLFEAKLSGSSKEMINSRAKVIEFIHRVKGITPAFASTLVAIASKQLKSLSELDMMHTMLRIANTMKLEGANGQKLSFKESFKLAIERIFGKKKKELLEQCFKKVGGGAGKIAFSK